MSVKEEISLSVTKDNSEQVMKQIIAMNPDKKERKILKKIFKETRKIHWHNLLGLAQLFIFEYCHKMIFTEAEEFKESKAYLKGFIETQENNFRDLKREFLIENSRYIC